MHSILNHFSSGGFKSFSAAYPHLCVTSSAADLPPTESTLLGGLTNLRISSGGPGAARLPTDPALPPSPVSRDDGCADCDEPASPPASFPVEVLPHLYLGDATNSADLENLDRLGIR